MEAFNAVAPSLAPASVQLTQSFYQEKNIWTYSYTDSTGALVNVQAQYIYTNMDAQGNPCVVTPQGSGTYVTNGCVMTTLSIFSASPAQSGLYNVYKQTTDQSLVGSISGLYYQSGAQQFTIDNWTGTMTFTGVNQAPSWNAANASAGTNASGVYGTAGATGLVDLAPVAGGGPFGRHNLPKAVIPN